MTGASNGPRHGRVPVILVRHGVTPWNREGLVQGWTDIPLSDAGRRQAGRVAEHLAGTAVARIITSDLSRARETAEIVARLHGLSPEIHPELREYHCGEWEGQPYLDIRANQREAFFAWFNDPEVPTPGGESMAQASRRATPVIDRVLRELAAAGESDRALLVIGHGGINRLIAAHLLGIDLEVARRMRLDNASLSIFEPFLGGWALKLWNGTGHLDGLPEADEGPTASKVG
jgi:broad specificity phosphatase PhoE